MRIRIVTQRLPHTASLEELVQKRLYGALGRLVRSIDNAVVSFEDVNGPRGGQDIECRIRLLVRAGSEINVSAVAALPSTALSDASHRARRCLMTRTRRGWMRRRRPRRLRSPVRVA